MNTLSKVICVDDDPNILAIVKLSLEDLAGFEIETFDSGAELIQVINDLSTDLILMDMMMPKYTGLDTLKILRENGSIPKFPVIFMTAKAQKHEVAEYLTAGAVSVIVKPFDPITLGDQLSDLWATHHFS